MLGEHDEVQLLVIKESTLTAGATGGPWAAKWRLAQLILLDWSGGSRQAGRYGRGPVDRAVTSRPDRVPTSRRR